MALQDNPEILAKIATLRAAGLTQQVIGDSMGIDQSTVSDTINGHNKDYLEQLIDQTRRELVLKALPKAQANIIESISLYNPNKPKETTSTDDTGKTTKVNNELLGDYWGARWSEKLMESIGILGSSAPSVFIQQIFNRNQILVSPVIERLVDVANHQGEELPEDDDINNDR